MNKSYQNLLEKHAILTEDFENLKVDNMKKSIREIRS